jgi:uncharacterized protein (TIGR03083 family)
LRQAHIPGKYERSGLIGPDAEGGEMVDDRTMMWDEVADIGDLIQQLDDEAFDAPSLCPGWAVRDVLGHMGFVHTASLPGLIRRSAFDRFAFNTLEPSTQFFAGKTVEEIRQFWADVMVAQHPRAGFAKISPARFLLLDHVVHNQDMRRPTGISRTIPSERLIRALQEVRRQASPGFNPKRNVSGLTLTASDIGWTAGDGPVVEGPGEAIVVTGAGRAAALEELSGEGVSILRGRLGL